MITRAQEIVDLVDVSARIGMAPCEWLAVLSPDDGAVLTGDPTRQIAGAGFPDTLSAMADL